VRNPDQALRLAADVLRQPGEYAPAEQLLAEAVEAMERSDGPNTPPTPES
jgi:hypothetical protein